jgi:hypothetical protein
MTSATPKHPTLVFKDGKWENRRKTTVNWNGNQVVIPHGYRCDLGSVPWLFEWIVQSTGKGNLAFLVHDYLYDDDTPDIMSREHADRCMYDLLIYSGMAKWRATVAWRGVRRGGWISFKRAD